MDNQRKIDLLYKLKKEVEKSDHQLLVAQINEVIRKIYKQKKVISFVGHFSSGKSSLINHLLGKDILPSSPVPTTSNSAQITISQQEGIIVNLEGQQYAVVQDYAEVKKVNTENSRIESVEINYKDDKLPVGLTLQDTPGIDAAFTNHEQNTMKYLLTSDVIVYTVEYNHVESEKNFNELKRLNDMNVPVLFVINQVDKHNEEEIPFNLFRQQIEANIKLWDIELAGIYFTSIYAHELNQFDELKQQLFSSMLVEDSSRQYFDRIVQYITTEQLDYLQNQQQEILSSLDMKAEEVPAAKQSAQEKWILTDEQSVLQDADTAQNFFISRIRDILKNAYIIPFDIREEIHSLLEVYADNYKVGGLFGREKKLNDLRQQRMNEVLKQLNASIEKQVNFHVRALYQQYAKYASNDFSHTVNQLHYELNAEDLTALMQSQSIITSDYVLNYTDQLKKYIEQTVVKENRKYIEMFIKSLNMSELSQDDSIELEQLKRYEKIQEMIDSLVTRNYQHYYIHIENSLDRLTGRQQIELTFQQESEAVETVRVQQKKTTADIEAAAAKLKQYQKVTYFKDMTDRLSGQLERINNDVTRIVVFGAFSAGKSSLINALLGRKILVSSPNPTTAAITEISYGQQHQVKFKTTKMMLGELNRIGRPYKIESDSIEDWLNLFDRTKPELDHQYMKLIQAVRTNYSQYRTLMETAAVQPMTEQEINHYTAEDEHSAFVDRIYLKYELEFLKDKVIIDSPGIGSTNMRHTNETTEIIADSDLLIYVSYYNHVFTESDKAFITYLNDLQVLNEDNETFYVVNAIDLAKNEQEIEQVKHYFSSELDALGVPAVLFELSSRQSDSERFNHFRQSVDHFSRIDSRRQKIAQFANGIAQLEHRAHEIVNHFSAAREQEQRDMEYYNSIQHGPFTEHHINQSLTLAEQELNEQLTFLKDRLNIQLYDIIKIYYNQRETDQTGYNETLADKLEAELSMIPPRVNQRYNKGLQDVTSVTRQTLLEHQLIVNIDTVKLIELPEAFQVKFKPVTVKVSGRSYSTKAAVDALYELIHEQSMAVVTDILQQYKLMIVGLSEQQTAQQKKYIAGYNKQVQHDIIERKQHQLNDDIVRQIQEVIR